MIDNIKYGFVIGFFSFISFIAISTEAISIKHELIKNTILMWLHPFVKFKFSGLLLFFLQIPIVAHHA